MANVDVISLIFESFELIKKHYREVAFPLVVLVLMSGIGHLGGSPLYSPPGQRQAGGLDAGSPITNAMQSSSLDYSVLGGALLAIVAVVIAVAFFYGVAMLSVWFYVSEHFNAILNKQALRQDWQARMKRHLGKALVMGIFDWALIAAFIILLVAGVLLAKPAGVLAMAFLGGIVLVCAIIALAFFSAAWMYYAMDGLPFFSSLRRSVSLVGSNLAHFFVFYIIFAMVGAGATIASFYACCFSFIVTPLIMVFFSLLSRVTLLEMKLAMEPAGGKKN